MYLDTSCSRIYRIIRSSSSISLQNYRSSEAGTSDPFVVHRLVLTSLITKSLREDSLFTRTRIFPLCYFFFRRKRQAVYKTRVQLLTRVSVTLSEAGLSRYLDQHRARGKGKPRPTQHVQ